MAVIICVCKSFDAGLGENKKVNKIISQIVCNMYPGAYGIHSDFPEQTQLLCKNVFLVRELFFKKRPVNCIFFQATMTFLWCIAEGLQVCWGQKYWWGLEDIFYDSEQRHTEQFEQVCEGGQEVVWRYYSGVEQAPDDFHI